MYISQKKQCVSNLKLEIWLESRLTSRWLSPKNALFNGRIPFLWFANTGIELPFSKISWLKLQSHEVMLAKRNGKLIAVSFLFNLTPLGLPHVKKERLCSRAKSTWKRKFHPDAVFSARAHRSVMPSENFALSSINKDQLKDL